MTLQEIDDLTVEDVFDILNSRVINNNYDEDSEETYVPSRLELEEELVSYSNEQVIIEIERIRVQDLQDRIDNLSDANYSHAVLYPMIPNAALYRKVQILTNSNHEEAESNLVLLESKDAELKLVTEVQAIIDNRKAEYPTIEEIVVAIVEDDTVVLDEIKARRAAVKAKYPKS
jgi:hypothetical protein